VEDETIPSDFVRHIRCCYRWAWRVTARQRSQ
jgi:hypothetical protein